MEFLGIYWANSNIILYTPIVVFLLFLIIKNYLRVSKSVDLLAHAKLRTTIFSHFSLTRYFIKTLCMCVTLLLLFFALMRPQWGKREEKVVQEGRDVLILLDISRSMLAQDFKPSRLAFAKLKIRNLLEQLEADRVGLVLFSGSAFLQCPLTADHAAFSMFLDQVDVETISSGTTAIDAALANAVQVYAKSVGRKNKLVLLVTDGEDFSINLDAVKKQAEKEHVRVFALGVATPAGAPVPILDEKGLQVGHEKDDSGSVVLSKLNETLLQDVCKKMNGTYFRAGYDDTDINALVSKIKSFEKEQFADRQITQYEDQYPWFLGIAFLFLLLEWLL